MRAVVQDIDSFHFPKWPAGVAPSPQNECATFTVTIGVEGDLGGTLFDVTVASKAYFRTPHRRGKFVGLVVDEFRPDVIDRTIRDRVEQIETGDWDTIVNRLRPEFRWEYEGYRGC